MTQTFTVEDLYEKYPEIIEILINWMERQTFVDTPNGIGIFKDIHFEEDSVKAKISLGVFQYKYYTIIYKKEDKSVHFGEFDSIEDVWKVGKDIYSLKEFEETFNVIEIDS